MKRILLFLSSLFLICPLALYGQTGKAVEVEENSSAKFYMDIDFGKAEVSGLLILRPTEQEIKGAVVNEFGVSILNFVYDRSNGKLKIENIAKMLDKWYIKRILKQDIAYAVELLYAFPRKLRNGYTIVEDANSLGIINKKRKIFYNFTPLNVKDEATE